MSDEIDPTLPESLSYMLNKTVQIAYKFPMGGQGGLAFPGTSGKCIAVDSFGISIQTEEGRRTIRHEEVQYYDIAGISAPPPNLTLPTTFNRG